MRGGKNENQLHETQDGAREKEQIGRTIGMDRGETATEPLATFQGITSVRPRTIINTKASHKATAKVVPTLRNLFRHDRHDQS